jgi:proton glutamate symport protein
VGIPGEGIALILGVDRILDMCRTVPNVTGDLLTSLVITKSEGLPFRPVEDLAAAVPTPDLPS